MVLVLGLGAHLMKWIGSSENLLTQQPVNSHLALFHRAIRCPGQNLVELERKASVRVSVQLRTRVSTRVRTRVRVQVRTQVKGSGQDQG